MLAFTPGSAGLSAADVTALRRLAPRPGSGDQARLITGGSDAYARAVAVSAVIGVAVQPFAGAWPDHVGERVGMLEFIHPAALARACEERGLVMPDQLWPLLPDAGRVLAPPGCATSQDLAAMVVDSNDLFEGKALAPAEAQPFVDAARRYDDRNLSKPPYGQDRPAPDDELGASAFSPFTGSLAASDNGAGTATSNPLLGGSGSAGTGSAALPASQ